MTSSSGLQGLGLQLGGCQNCGPLFGYPKYSVPYYNRDPKRDHHFDNHPFRDKRVVFKMQGIPDLRGQGPTGSKG